MRSMKISPGVGAVDAHANVYRARQLLDRQTPSTIADALELFERVSHSAPDYARGHSGIADCYCDLFRLGAVDRLTAIEVARPAAERALAIDPDSIEGHTALGTVSAWLDRDRISAEASFSRARQLGRNARCSRIYGTFLVIIGNPDEAALLFQEARRIEPFSIQQDIAEAFSHYQARRYQDLFESETHSMGLDRPAEALVFTALGRVFSGGETEARAMIPAIERADITQPDLLFIRAEIEAWLGEPARAQQLISGPAAGITAFGRATLAASIAADDLALAALNEAVDRFDLATAWIATDPRFDRLRANPRFVALSAKLKAKVVQ
jgi:Tfp pilus assembly protein PilF